MSVWTDAFTTFTPEQRQIAYISNNNYWGGVYNYDITEINGRRSLCKGVSFTAEAYRFCLAHKTNIRNVNVRDRNLATVVEFRGFKIHVLDWVALVEPTKEEEKGAVHFYNSSKLYYRVNISKEVPFILNKENVLNHALFKVAEFAAKREGRKARDVDYEGLVRPEPLTDLYQAMDLSSDAAVEYAKAYNPLPQLSVNHVPQT